MANTSIWPGSSSFFPGNTPFGFYDNDTDFQTDADRVAMFVARRLGYPLVDVELQDINFYTAFEEAVTTYGNEVYAYQIAQNFLSLEGSPTGSNLNNTLTRPNLGAIVRISEQYGVEAGVGGNVTWRTGSLDLKRNVQKYNLNEWAISQSIDAGNLEIKRIFYESVPPIIRYFDPYAGTGTGIQSLLETFGFGQFSPGINFLLMPIFFDVLKIQAIELNDQIRKSAYSFDLVNNQLRVFPIPTRDSLMFFQYILEDERADVTPDSRANLITNVSNVPYANPTFSQINSVGKMWIYQYSLALSKEMLGYVRGKYATVPIPGAEIALNQSDLLTDARDEKSKLLEQLRATLDIASRKTQLENQALESEAIQKTLNNSPLSIYIF